jgi:hypothetical protein
MPTNEPNSVEWVCQHLEHDTPTFLDTAMRKQIMVAGTFTSMALGCAGDLPPWEEEYLLTWIYKSLDASKP